MGGGSESLCFSPHFLTHKPDDHQYLQRAGDARPHSAGPSGTTQDPVEAEGPHTTAKGLLCCVLFFKMRGTEACQVAQGSLSLADPQPPQVTPDGPSDSHLCCYAHAHSLPVWLLGGFLGN